MNWNSFLSVFQPSLSIQCSCFTDLGLSSTSFLCTFSPFLFSTLRIASSVNVCNSPGWGVWCRCPLFCTMAGLRSSIWSVSWSESTKSVWTDFWNISQKRDKLGWSIGKTKERRQERKLGFGTSLISVWFYNMLLRVNPMWPCLTQSKEAAIGHCLWAAHGYGTIGSLQRSGDESVLTDQ